MKSLESEVKHSSSSFFPMKPEGGICRFNLRLF